MRNAHGNLSVISSTQEIILVHIESIGNPLTIIVNLWELKYSSYGTHVNLRRIHGDLLESILPRGFLQDSLSIP